MQKKTCVRHESYNLHERRDSQHARRPWLVPHRDSEEKAENLPAGKNPTGT
jgi:hypothetical protein